MFFNTTHKMVMLGMVKILDLHGFTILLYNNCIYIYIYMCSKQSQQTIPASSNPHLLLVFVCEVKVHGSGGEFGCFFLWLPFEQGRSPKFANGDLGLVEGLVNKSDSPPGF